MPQSDTPDYLRTRHESFEVHEAHLRVQAVRRVVEHDIVFGAGAGSLDAETTWWAAQMLHQADRFLEIAAAA